MLNEGAGKVFRAHDRESHGLENRCVLPGLATMGQGNNAIGFQLLGRGVEFFEGRGQGNPGVLKYLRVGPEPVNPVHIHRYGDIAVLVLHDIGNHRRNQLVPVVGLGHIIKAGQKAQLGPLPDIQALDLGGSRRVAGDSAGLEHGHGRFTATTGHGKVFPGVALIFHHFLQCSRGPGFTTSGPPVQNFNLAGLDSRRGQQCSRQSKCRKGFVERSHMALRVFVLLATLESMARNDHSTYQREMPM